MEFANDYGFSAHKDFIKVTQYILEEDNEKVELMDIEFGRNGKPCVVAEVGKEALNVVSQLEKTAGPVISPGSLKPGRENSCFTFWNRQ